MAKALGMDLTASRDTVDKSTSTQKRKRPDSLIYLRSAVVCKGEEKDLPQDLEVAAKELMDKASE